MIKENCHILTYGRFHGRKKMSQQTSQSRAASCIRDLKPRDEGGTRSVEGVTIPENFTFHAMVNMDLSQNWVVA